MSNTSATGGYLVPATDGLLPAGLTLKEFIQTVLVGLSGITGNLVRPAYQVQQPQQPTILNNWIAFRIAEVTPDAYAYTNTVQNPDTSITTTLLRNEELEIQCSFYGPDALDVLSQVRDGFQIQQNLDALNSVMFGYTGVSRAIQTAELVNELWYDRYQMSVFIKRQIVKTYPILSLVSASGNIFAQSGLNTENIAWQTN